MKYVNYRNTFECEAEYTTPFVRPSHRPEMMQNHEYSDIQTLQASLPHTTMNQDRPQINLVRKSYFELSKMDTFYDRRLYNLMI